MWWVFRKVQFFTDQSVHLVRSLQSFLRVLQDALPAQSKHFTDNSAFATTYVTGSHWVYFFSWQGIQAVPVKGGDLQQ
jgi:hypothetical protein